MKKKKGKLRRVLRKTKENGEFESFKSESLCFKWGTPIMFGP